MVGFGVADKMGLEVSHALQFFNILAIKPVVYWFLFIAWLGIIDGRRFAVESSMDCSYPTDYGRLHSVYQNHCISWVIA